MKSRYASEGAPPPAAPAGESPAGAAVIFTAGLLLFLAIHLVASTVAPYALWSAHHLRFTGGAGRLFCALLVVLALVPAVRAAAVRLAERLAALFAEPRPSRFVPAAALAALLFYLFRIDNPFLGDGSLLGTLAANPKPPDFGSAGYGSLWLHELLYRAVSTVRSGVSGSLPYVLTSVLAGGAGLVLTARTAALLARGPAGRALLFVVFATSGGALFSFGYREHYPVMQLAVLAYLYTSLRHIRGRGSLAAATVSLACACALHLSAAALVPSWAVVASRGRLPGPRAARRLLLILVPAAGAAFLLLRYSERFYGGLEAFVPLLREGTHSYSLLSQNHWSFVANELFLLLGAGLLLTLLSLPRRSEREAAPPRGGLFLAAATLCGLAFLVLVDPKLGPRDWDLMAIPLYPMLALLGFAALDSRVDPPRSLASWIMVAALIHTVPWVDANRDRRRAVEMTLTMVVRDLHYANPEARAPKALGVLLSRAGFHEQAGRLFEMAMDTKADAQNLYNLGTNHARLGDYEKAVEYLDQAIQAEPGYEEAYVNLAGALLELDRADEAENVLRGLIGVAPDNARGRAMLADLLNGRGRMAEAIPQYEAALRLDSTTVELWANLAIARAKVGDRVGAAVALRRAAALEPENERVRRMLADLEED